MDHKKSEIAKNIGKHTNFAIGSEETEKKDMSVIIFIFIGSGLGVAACSTLLNNTLESPGYPNNYPDNMDCYYRVPIPQNMTMNISFIYFDLEYHSSCR